MKRMLLLLLALALLLPGMAAAEQSVTELIREGLDTTGRIPGEVAPPEMSICGMNAEASWLMSRGSWGGWDETPETAGGVMKLEDGYLCLAYGQAKAYKIEPMAPGAKIVCLEEDLSPRWALTDPRLDGTWYREVTELPDALLLGGYEGRTPDTGAMGVPSLMLLDKADGSIRWQWQPTASASDGLQFWADEAGIYVANDNGKGPRMRDGNPGAQLTLLDMDGEPQWTRDYHPSHGALWIRDIRPLGDGLLLLCRREDLAHIVLYVDRQGQPLGWFLVPEQDLGEPGIAYPGLALGREGAVYLGGWTLARRGPEHVGKSVFFVARIDEEVFLDKNN